MVHTGFKNVYSRTFPGLYHKIQGVHFLRHSHCCVTILHILHSHASKNCTQWNLGKTTPALSDEVLAIGTSKNDIPCSSKEKYMETNLNILKPCYSEQFAHCRFYMQFPLWPFEFIPEKKSAKVEQRLRATSLVVLFAKRGALQYTRNP